LYSYIKNIDNKDFVYKDKDVVGVDVEFEEPKHSDIVIDTNIFNIEDSLIKIINRLEH